MPFPVPRRAALPALALVTTWSTAAAQATVEPVHASVLVTATRSPQTASEILSDHLIVSADDIARSGAGSVVDLLQKQRAIEVARNGGPGTASSVFIRGADSKQNVVLVDGVRIGSSTTGAANWSALSLANIDRIEIVYGPLATTYGADAIGGVVQLFTKRGTGAPRVSAAAGAGSNAAR
ncbi:MAG: TonB-dependent receptor plug domain-containing protein, partial [Telluria sp.]